MKKVEKHIVRKIQIITYIIIVALIIIAIVLDAISFIEPSVFAFVIYGFILVPLGIFGLIKNEVTIANTQSIKYKKNSIAGKMANVTLIIMGFLLLVTGIIELIS